MSEKKTFKNPDLTVFNDGSGWKITPEGVTTYSGSHKWFRSEEWDMEVTFTKKMKPLAVGDVIKYDNYDGSKTATIMAIDDDQCWLKFSDGSHATWELDEIYR